MNSIEAKNGFLSFLVVFVVSLALYFVGKTVLNTIQAKNKQDPSILNIEEKPTRQPAQSPKSTLTDTNGDGVINALDTPLNLPK